MPANLVKAHRALDRAVDAERVAFLFRRYAELTSLLPASATDTSRLPGKDRQG